MKEKIKKIWNCVWPILWWAILLLLVICSFYGSYLHSKKDDKKVKQAAELNMLLGATLMLNICQRDSVDTVKQAEAVYNIESKRIINNIYKPE